MASVCGPFGRETNGLGARVRFAAHSRWPSAAARESSGPARACSTSHPTRCDRKNPSPAPTPSATTQNTAPQVYPAARRLEPPGVRGVLDPFSGFSRGRTSAVRRGAIATVGRAGRASECACHAFRTVGVQLFSGESICQWKVSDLTGSHTNRASAIVWVRNFRTGARFASDRSRRPKTQEDLVRGHSFPRGK